ncbi:MULTISPECIES: Pr6Pr family membrane protein [unclassified Saccharothrix]|uniref:Pr6Pr family membrane protein n=1 Tax=unclassified Saccharothrix TaxID=2593673 RepID=UPI00307D30EA
MLASLCIQLVLIFTGGADANSGQTTGGLGVRLWRLFSYFTIQSNLIVLVTAAVLALRPTRDGPVWRVVRLDGLLGILITGLVFAIVLAPQVHLTGAALVATIGFHYISPWATIGAWLALGPRPRITWGTVAAAFVWPVAWLLYIFTQGAFTRWYPYPFLDVTKLGLADALRNALLVVAVAVVFAVVFKLLDERLPAPLR